MMKYDYMEEWCMGERLDYGPDPGANEEAKSAEDTNEEGEQNPKDVVYIQTDIGYFPI